MNALRGALGAAKDKATKITGSSSEKKEEPPKKKPEGIKKKTESKAPSALAPAKVGSPAGKSGAASPAKGSSSSSTSSPSSGAAGNKQSTTSHSNEKEDSKKDDKKQQQDASNTTPIPPSTASPIRVGAPSGRSGAVRKAAADKDDYQAQFDKDNVGGIPSYDAVRWFTEGVTTVSKEEGDLGMTLFELEVCRLHDDLRNNPGKYAEHLEKVWLPTWNEEFQQFQLSSGCMLTKEGTNSTKECIKYLKKKVKDKYKPKYEKMTPSKLLVKTAKLHAHTLGRLGLDQHWSPCLVSEERFDQILKSMKFSEEKTKVGGRDGIATKMEMDGRKGEQYMPDARASFLSGYKQSPAENLAFGPPIPIEMVLGLCIDDGVPDRGHRTNLFYKDFKYIGISVQYHAFSFLSCVCNYDLASHRDEVNPDQEKKVANRINRRLKWNWPPPKSKGDIKKTDFPLEEMHIHDQAIIHCKKCKKQGLKVNNVSHHFIPDGIDDIEHQQKTVFDAYLCLDCDVCFHCEKRLPISGVNYIKSRKAGTTERFHAKCATEHNHMWCANCEKDVNASMDGYFELTKKEHADWLADLAKSSTHKDAHARFGLDGKMDHDPFLCDKCFRKLADKVRNQKMAEFAEKKRKCDEWLKTVRTCRKCGKYCPHEGPNTENPVVIPDPSDPENTEKEYRICQKCWANQIQGICFYCDVAIQRKHEMAMTELEEGSGKQEMFHRPGPGWSEDCMKLCWKNKNCKKGIEPPEDPDKPSGMPEKCIVCEDFIELGQPQTKLNDGSGPVHVECREKAMLIKCDHCGKDIKSDEPRSEVDGKTMHGPCVDAFFASKREASKARSDKAQAEVDALNAANGVSSSSSSSKKTCSVCKKDINGPPLFFEGEHMHTECFEKRPQGNCLHCGKPVPMLEVSRIPEQPGEVFHGDCVVPFFQAESKKKAEATIASVKKQNEELDKKREQEEREKKKQSEESKSTPTTTTTTTTVISSSTDGDVCAHCGKGFTPEHGTTRHRTQDGKLWHPPCRDKANAKPCKYCGEMIKSIYDQSEVEGEGVFHGDCVGPYFSNGCKPK